MAHRHDNIKWMTHYHCFAAKKEVIRLCLILTPFYIALFLTRN